MRARIETRLGGAIALVLGAALIWGSPHAGAETITLGQIAPPASTGSGDTVTFQVSNAPTSPAYTVPAGSWTITSWSVRGGTMASTARIQVWRPTATAGQHMLLAQSSDLAMVPPGGVGPFSTSIAAQGGDVLGLRVGSGNIDDVDVGSTMTGDVVRRVFPPGSDPSQGQTVGGAGSDYAYNEFGGHVNIAATLFRPDQPPRNDFSFGEVDRNKKKGTAILIVIVPAAGELALSGNGVQTAEALAVVAKTVAGAGPVELLIKAKGKKKRKLNRSGKVKLTPSVTFTPTFGTPNTKSLKVKLKKR